MAQSFNKREREQKRKNTKKQKLERKLERKENNSKGKSLDEMLAYVDEYGNLSATPPEKRISTDDIPPVVANSNALNPEQKTRSGIVTFFDATKGYGFIRDVKTQESIFVHINSSSVQLENNLKVEFEVEKGPRGLAAVNVTRGA